MVIGVCKVSLYFDNVFSLKEKRMILKSVTDKVKNKFNVSVAEISQNDKHQNAIIGISCVSNSSSHADSMMSSVSNFIEKDARLVIIDISTEQLLID